MKTDKITRREFVTRSTAALGGSIVAAKLVSPSAEAAAPAGAFQAMGTRVGEVTDSTAIVWTRLTQNATRNNSGVVVPQRQRQDLYREDAPLTVPVEQLEGACPGAPGRVQIRHGTREDLSDARSAEAVAVPENDFIGEIKLTGLKPGTVYHYVSEVAGGGGAPEETKVRGKFETAPSSDVPANLRFCVMTCQAYRDRDHAEGHNIYPAMLALAPQFACLTGDLVYYDTDSPHAITPQLARFHWERMFSLPRLVEFTRNVGCYWLKDDHDTLKNDSWPGQKLGDLTFTEGQKIFRQQAPMDDEGPDYRTIRWGRDLQVWFTEGRDFRSPNTMPDGPNKTIWGEEQKGWFKRTMKESDATWKVLISPTPLVGPDRGKGKNDNHANGAFTHEGDEIRGWLRDNVPDNFFVICGDRHWQYHSVHPGTGLNEFSVGPASDEHASGSPGFTPDIHKFHRVKGGFLSVTLTRAEKRSTILCEHRDVHGKVVYAWTKERGVA